MGAFVLLHFEIAPALALRYLIPNLLGSVILVATAWIDRQWGFLLLEAAWIVVISHAIYARQFVTVYRAETFSSGEMDVSGHLRGVSRTSVDSDGSPRKSPV